MKKTLFVLLLAGLITFAGTMATNAADIKFSKPTIKIDTSKEQNAIEKAKADAAKRQAEREKAIKEKQAEIEKAKADAAKRQAEREKEAKARQAEKEKEINQVKQNAKNTAEGFKNLFK